MPGKIFINYRRDDSRAEAARVRDRLAQAFGPVNVFMDVDNLLIGQRFDKELEKALEQCDVFLAVMGSRWLDELNRRRELGERDYVREEIAAALARGTLVIPVLLERATLPRADQLDPDIAPLVLHQKHGVSHETFGRDIAALIDGIKAARKLAARRPALPWGRVTAAIAAVAVLGAGAVFAIETFTKATSPVAQEFQKPSETIHQAEDAKLKSDADAAKAKADEERRLAALADEQRRLTLLAEEKKSKEAEQQRKSEDVAKALSMDASDKQKDATAAASGQQPDGSKQAMLSAPPRPAETGGDVPKGDAARQPGEAFRDCPNCPELVVVGKGTFTLGSPASEAEREDDEDQQHVAIDRPFAAGRYAVTFDEWDACVGDGGCGGYRPSDRGWGRGKRPVINVSWEDAQLYVKWLSKKSGKPYRLLSEREREYLTRASTTTPFWWGGTITPDKANYNGTLAPYQGGGEKGAFRKRTLEVDALGANPWGFFNVHGNVSEWVEDCWNEHHEGGPSSGAVRLGGDCGKRVLRGGSWNAMPGALRSAYRSRGAPGFREDDLGFRVARTLAN